MTILDFKNMLVGTLKGWFPNKKTLDKLSTTDNELTYNNEKIDKPITNNLDNSYKGVKFQFAVDSAGNYGYIKDGADTVTPFKTGGTGYVCRVETLDSSMYGKTFTVLSPSEKTTTLTFSQEGICDVTCDEEGTWTFTVGATQKTLNVILNSNMIFSKTYTLYDHGKYTSGEISTKVSYGSVTFQDSYIFVKGCNLVYSTNPIDITDFNTLNILWDGSTTATNRVLALVTPENMSTLLSTWTSKTKTIDSYAMAKLYGTAYNNGDTEYSNTLDISNLSGSYYIVVARLYHTTYGQGQNYIFAITLS